MIPICTKCGCVVTDGYIYAINLNTTKAHYVNPDSTEEYYLCHDCLESEIENGNIYKEEACTNT